jgi:hypothetical protein
MNSILAAASFSIAAKSAGVEDGASGATAQRAEEGGGVFDRTQRADRDRIARLQATALQRGRDTVDQRVERGVIELAFAVDHGGAPRRAGCGSRDERIEGDEVGHGGLPGFVSYCSRSIAAS